MTTTVVLITAAHRARAQTVIIQPLTEATSKGCRDLQLNTAVGGSSNLSGSDLVRITGDLALMATAGNRFSLQLQTVTLAGGGGLFTGFDQNANYSWQIATFSASLTGFDPSVIGVDTSGFANAYRGTFGVSSDGLSLYLNYTAVPEPTFGLWVASSLTRAAFGMARYRRRVRCAAAR